MAGARRGPKVALIATVLIVVGVLYGVVGATQLRSSQQELEAARAGLSQAQESANSGDVEGATGQVAAASRQLGSAESRLNGVWLRPLRLLPIARPNIGFLRAVVAAGTTISSDAEAFLDEFQGGTGGIAAYVPSSGSLPLDRLEGLVEPMRTLATRASTAQALVSAAQDSRLLPAVHQAGAAVLERLSQLALAASQAAAIATALPTLLGDTQPKRYFFAATTPAELRGAGGLIGAYTVATADAGRLTFGQFQPVVPLGNVGTDEVEAPDAEYARRYNQYGGAGFWQNINMTPDFPSAATAIERLYQARTGQTVDGVMLVDPFALKALLEVTGPVEVPEIGPVSADNVIATLARDTYDTFDTHRERKEVLGSVAAQVFGRFLQGDAAADNPVAALKALAHVVGNRHLMIHSTDPDVQTQLETARIAGRLLNPAGDYLNVVGQNASANKLDFYADRRVDYQVALDTDGSAWAKASTTLTNNGPTSGMPKYVIGPNAGDFVAGENATILNVYCAKDCAVHRFERDGEAVPMRAETELGHPVFWSYERLKTGESVDLAYQWLVPNVWQGDDGNGHYRLTFQNQVTIRPTTFRLQLDLPPHTELVYSHPELTSQDGHLVWEGAPRGDIEFDVYFRRIPGRFQRFIERQLDRLFD